MEEKCNGQDISSLDADIKHQMRKRSEEYAGETRGSIMLDWLRENDVGAIIAPWVFIGLMEAQAICLGIVTKLSWWIIVLICLCVFVVVMLYRPLFEYVMVLPTLGMIGFLVYSIFDDEISIPTSWTVFIIVWVVIYLIYMVFLSTLREYIDERRYGRW